MKSICSSPLSWPALMQFMCLWSAGAMLLPSLYVPAQSPGSLFQRVHEYGEEFVSLHRQVWKTGKNLETSRRTPPFELLGSPILKRRESQRSRGNAERYKDEDTETRTMLRLFSKTQSTIRISSPYDFLGSSAISALSRNFLSGYAVRFENRG